MIGKEVIKSEPIPSSKVKQIIEDFGENNELNYEQNLTLNHLASISSASSTEYLLNLARWFNVRFCS